MEDRGRGRYGDRGVKGDKWWFLGDTGAGEPAWL